MTKQEILDKLKGISRYDISYNQRYQSVEKDGGSDHASGWELEEIIEELEKDIQNEKTT